MLGECWRITLQMRPFSTGVAPYLIHIIIKIITCWQAWACVSYVQVKEEGTTNIHQGIYPLYDKHDQNGA